MQLREIWLELCVLALSSLIIILSFLGVANGWLWVPSLFSILVVFLSAHQKIRDNSQINRIEIVAIDTKNDTGALRDYFEKQRAETEEKQRLISKLIDKGLLSERDVYEKIRSKEFFYMFCYQRSLPKDIQRSLKLGVRNPVHDVLSKLGLIRVGTKHNFYVIMPESLPEKFRSVKALEYLYVEMVKNEWSELLEQLKKRKLKLYEKYSKESPFDTTYMISKSRFYETSIDHIGINCFSSNFKHAINSVVDLKTLKKQIEIKNVEVRKFVLSISYDLLLEGIQKTDKELILSVENDMKKKLKIEFFTDYADQNKGEIKKVLLESFNEEKAEAYSSLISERSQKYKSILSELGVDLRSVQTS